MIFHKGLNVCNLQKTPDIIVNGIKIDRVLFTKFLGVIFEETLSWKTHITSVETTLSKNLGIFYRIRNLLNYDCRMKLYYSLIQSHMSYGNTVWGSTHKTKLSGILKKQKHALRLIHFQSRDSYSQPLFKRTNVLNIYHLNLYFILISIFKIKQNLAPSIFIKQFKLIQHKYITRYSRQNFIRGKSSSKVTSFKISDRGIKLWNSLLNETEKSITTIGKFKKQIKKLLFDLGDGYFEYF